MKKNKDTNWTPTTNRFVGFFDIMGFKDFVYKNNHEDIMSRVQNLTEFSRVLKTDFKKEQIPMHERIKAIVVSDSVIISTLGETEEDLNCIIASAGILISGCLKNNIPIKGALSYGKFTFNEKESLFVGKPLIDAAHLESTIEFYGCIIDHNVESKIQEFNTKTHYDSFLTRIKTPTKEGIISYKVLNPYYNDIEDIVSNFYLTVSGKARRYVDNTLDIYSNIKNMGMK